MQAKTFAKALIENGLAPCDPTSAFFNEEDKILIASFADGSAFCADLASGQVAIADTMKELMALVKETMPDVIMKTHQIN